MNVGIAAPKSLELAGNLAEKWRAWKEKFDIYMVAIGYDEKSAKQKTGLLLNIIGDEGLDVYRTFEFEEGKEWDYKTVITKFEEHCKARKNTFRNRELLWKLTQKPDQTVDQFVGEIKRRIGDCEITDRALRDSLTKQRLIAGLRDEGCKRRLIDKEGEKLTLDEAIKMARNSEATKIEMKDLGFEADRIKDEVNAVKRRRQPPPQQQQKRYDNNYINNCSRCGQQHRPRQCPAYNKICAKCGIRNHFAVMCRSTFRKPISAQNHKSKLQNPRHKKKVASVEEGQEVQNEYSENEEEDSFYIGDNCSVLFEEKEHKEEKKGWWIEMLKLNKTLIPFKIDTGANVNILSLHDYKLLANKPKLSQPLSKLTAYGGRELNVMGRIIVTVERRGKHKLQMLVSDEDTQSIIGLGGIERLNLVQRVDTVIEDAKPVEKVEQEEFKGLEEYNDVFEGLGNLPGEHKVKLKENAVPVIEACRKIPFSLREKVKTELQRMEEKGVIEKVTEPTEWVNSMVIVHKTNGSIRICLDPRNLNRYIQREHYKMPTRDEIHSKFADAKIFSKFDASHGFWQIKLDKESSDLCTFNTPFGRYKYKRLPFGISSAPEVFHRIVHEIFDMPGVDTSMDDIIVYGKTQEQHDKRVMQVLKKCREVGLKLNKAKCEISKRELVYLGDTLTDQGVKPEKSKVEAIWKMERPTDKKGIQRFLGMVIFWVDIYRT